MAYWFYGFSLERPEILRIMTHENRAGLSKRVKAMDINRGFTQLVSHSHSGADQERGSPAVLCGKWIPAAARGDPESDKVKTNLTNQVTKAWSLFQDVLSSSNAQGAPLLHHLPASPSLPL